MLELGQLAHTSKFSFTLIFNFSTIQNIIIFNIIILHVKGMINFLLFLCKSITFFFSSFIVCYIDNYNKNYNFLYSFRIFVDLSVMLLLFGVVTIMLWSQLLHQFPDEIGLLSTVTFLFHDVMLTLGPLSFNWSVGYCNSQLTVSKKIKINKTTTTTRSTCNSQIVFS